MSRGGSPSLPPTLRKCDSAGGRGRTPGPRPGWGNEPRGPTEWVLPIVTCPVPRRGACQHPAGPGGRVPFHPPHHDLQGGSQPAGTWDGTGMVQMGQDGAGWDVMGQDRIGKGGMGWGLWGWPHTTCMSHRPSAPRLCWWSVRLILGAAGRSTAISPMTVPPPSLTSPVGHCAALMMLSASPATLTSSPPPRGR